MEHHNQFYVLHFFGIVRCIRKVFIFESYELIFVRSCRYDGRRKKEVALVDTLGNSLARNLFSFLLHRKEPSLCYGFLVDLLQSCHGNLYRKVINV